MEGEYAPRHFQVGFIVLSYVVSFVGSLSTLELLQLRTGTRGAYNWYLLIGSAITMGGIAIWCMHFIGNRAIILYNNEPNLQLQYSQEYTTLSVFVPIVVLFGAYLLCGTGDDTSMFWVIAGGFGAGFSIGGMHYLGNAGIANYTCVYEIGYIVGAVIIAVAATCIALSMFFRFQKSFTNGIWKRILVALLLALGVSGMHWTGVLGTQYRYNQLNDDRSVNRRDIVILTLVMSVIACCGLVGFAIFAGRARIQQRHRVQEVTLVSVTFDEDGKIMVHSDGTLPTATITDSFREKSFEETFGPTHWVFQWAYRTSSNWKSVSDLIPGMRQHVRIASTKRSSLNSYIVDYHLLFREQFCVAAQSLADITHRSLSSIGVLHTNLLTSGYDPERRGTGKVLFLVSQVEKQFHPHGFRYAAIDTVLPILTGTMQVPQSELSTILSEMALTASSPPLSLPASGVYVACFAPRRRKQANMSSSGAPQTVGSGLGADIEVLVNPKKPNQFLMIRLQESFLPTHANWLRQHSHETVAQLCGFSNPSVEFEARFSRCLQEMEHMIGDPFFRSATLEPSITTLAGGAVRLIVFRATPPSSYNNPQMRFIPFGLFDVMQRDDDLHARLIYREFSGRVHTTITAGNNNGNSFALKKLRAHGKHWSISSNKKPRSQSMDLEPIVSDSSNFNGTDTDLPGEKGFQSDCSDAGTMKGGYLRAGIMVSESVSVERITASECAHKGENEPKMTIDVTQISPFQRGLLTVDVRNLGTSARADTEGGTLETETWATALLKGKAAL